MKKAERIGAYVSGLGLGKGPFHECYLGYFDCFNSGRYYEAHDVLEHLWLRETGPDHTYFKGLIQIAGAFVHLKKQFERPTHPTDGRRLHPAVRLFRLGARNIAGFAPVHMGLDVEALCRMCDGLAAGIEASAFTRNPWRPDSGPRLSLTV